MRNLALASLQLRRGELSVQFAEPAKPSCGEGRLQEGLTGLHLAELASRVSIGPFGVPGFKM